MIKALRLAFTADFSLMLARIAIPTALQAMMASSRTVTDVIMVSPLGQEDIASIGFGSRYIFVLILAVLGVANGGAVLIAQYWGARKTDDARNALAATIVLSFIIGLLCFLISLLLAEPLASLASSDSQLTYTITRYISIASAMLIPFSIAFALSAGLRSIDRASIATYFALLGLLLNIFFNYILIYGNFGFKPLGVEGAAIASLLSYIVEVIALYGFIKYKNAAITPRYKNLFSQASYGIIKKILSVGLPISINSVIWALGLFTYNILVSQMGTSELAILALMTPIESIAIALFIGMSSATAVLVGHSLGRNELQQALSRSQSLIVWTMLVGILTFLLISIVHLFLLPYLFDIGLSDLKMLNDSLIVLSIVVMVRAFNVTIIVGIMRAGGDTRYAIFMDLASQWLVAIPLTYAAINYFHWSFPLVFLAINSEEIFKALLAIRRYKQKIWCRKLI